jgi:hypothetical protein
MKKTFFIAILALTIATSCKNDSKSEKQDIESSIEPNLRTKKQSDGLTLLKGEFVYYDGAAVLQTHAEIYGVLLTDKLEELNKKAKQYKTEPTDMVLVEVRGKITNKKHDKILWDNKVEVIEILNVKPSPKEKNNIIKLGH